MRATMIVMLLALPALAARGGLVLPQVAPAIHCDGELDEIAWRTPARTGAFVDRRGESAAPYSDARLLRDDRYVYLALYAADEDIRASDRFVVQLGGKTLQFTAGGQILPAIAGAQIAVDVDGSVDDPSNDDEEWVIEAALPIEAIPFARDGTVSAKISRCDRGKDGITRCGSWTGTLVRR